MIELKQILGIIVLIVVAILGFKILKNLLHVGILVAILLVILHYFGWLL